MVIMVFLQGVRPTDEFAKMSPVSHITSECDRGVLYLLPNAVGRIVFKAVVYDIVTKTCTHLFLVVLPILALQRQIG